jgi:adenylate kinase
MNTQDDNDRAAWLQGPPANCSALPGKVASPWRLVLLGAPGVGKGTQAHLLSQRLSACHLSTGDVFRAAANRADCLQTPAMTSALEYMRRGALVPDATVWEIVRERYGCLLCLGGFLLDGFPRTLAQAEALNLLMQDEKLSLSAVVNYELPLAEVASRLSGRRVCQECQSVFHIAQQPPKSEGLCDHCGGQLVQREDDRPESITIRLEAYEQSTAPLIQFYEHLGLLLPVNASGSPEEICARTMIALRQRSQPAFATFR